MGLVTTNECVCLCVMGVSLSIRHVDNHRLDTLLTQSPHGSVEGCTTTATFGSARQLVLTDARHSFVAWIAVNDPIEDSEQLFNDTGQPSLAQHTPRARMADKSMNGWSSHPHLPCSPVIPFCSVSETLHDLVGGCVW